MANSNKFAEVVAIIAEREEEFKPFEVAAIHFADDEPYWLLSGLKRLLGYSEEGSIQNAVNRAKIAASKVGWSIKEHFVDGSLHDGDGEMFLSKYAALLITVNADPHKIAVSVAQAFFALQTDRQQLEDEKRLKTRLDVATENRKLTGVAQEKGVRNFRKFNGVGISALYGGRSVAHISSMKRLPSKGSFLDYAGSEELAANLFRITQTAASLRRQVASSETQACYTHQRVARGVRQVIVAAGNTPPELLPPASTKIDALATQMKGRLARAC